MNRRVLVGKMTAVAIVLAATLSGCQHVRKGQVLLSQQQTEDAKAKLRTAYAAFNRGDIDAAVEFLDPNVEWIEPVEFPGGGSYRGIAGAKQYLKQSRAGAAQVISEPEQFITLDDRIVVFVLARVLPKGSNNWREIRLADVYTFRDGRAIKMHAFANREDALRWAGAPQVLTK